MGGLLLGNYLAECSKEAREMITAAHIISVPWNVMKCCDNMEKPYLNRLISKVLLKNLYMIVKRSKMFDDNKYDMKKMYESKTFKEFDSVFTSKHFGYDDLEHYYREASLDKKLHKMSVPLLSLSAADDSFQPLEGIYYYCYYQSSLSM